MVGAGGQGGEAHPATGDTLFVGLALNYSGGFGSRTITPPDGWTALPGGSGALTTGAALKVYYRVADGTESSSYTWTCSSNVHWAVGIVGISEYVGTYLASTANDTTADTSAYIPAVTMPAPSTYIVVMGWVSISRGDYDVTAAPSGWAELVVAYRPSSIAERASMGAAYSFRTTSDPPSVAFTLNGNLTNVGTQHGGLMGTRFSAQVIF